MRTKLVPAAAILALASAAVGASLQVTQVDDLGDGMYGYTFTAMGEDAQLKSFFLDMTVEAGECGRIHQNKAIIIPDMLEFDVNDESQADTYDGLGDPPYDKALDSWWGTAFYSDANVVVEMWADNLMHLEASTNPEVASYENVKALYLCCTGVIQVHGTLFREGFPYPFDFFPPPPYIKAEAGGPYVVGPDEVITLDGSMSDALNPIDAWDWDLDGDGEYDDLSGELPPVSYDYLVNDLGLSIGTQTIALKVTTICGVGIDAATLEIIPEPATLAMLVLGGVLLIRRRRA